VSEMAKRLFMCGFETFKVENCRSKGDHHDSDWLTVTVSSDQNVHPSQTLLLGNNLHIGDPADRAYAGPFEIGDDELVTVTFFVVNLAHSAADDQKRQAEQIALGVGSVVLATLSGIAAFEAFKAKATAQALLALTSGVLGAVSGVLGGLAGILGWAPSDPNCNGEILTRTISFLPGELAQRDPLFIGPSLETAKSPSECGNDPHSTVTFGCKPSDVAQSDWRFCDKCGVMFFEGFPSKGVCAAGGDHQAAGFNFVLPHDVPETSTAQQSWRFCSKCNSMFFDGSPNKGVCAEGGAHSSAGFNFVLPHAAPETPTAQQNWRFCGKCRAIFFNGSAIKGACAAGGAHEAVGLLYALPHDVPETPTAQQSWRFCAQCRAIYFDGFANKGVCAAGSVHTLFAHSAAGFNFVLPHDVPETPTTQQAFRFCSKCEVLFWDGSADKGVCAAGAGHAAAGFNFVLPHEVPEPSTAQQDWRFCVKCEAMYWDGSPNKGVCAATGTHEAAGFNFILPHG
jgi:uncharacterized protein with PIN domain